MIVVDGFYTPVLFFDTADIDTMDTMGVDAYFEALKDKGIFDVWHCQHYKGEIYFQYDKSGDTVCYDCLKSGEIGINMIYASFLLKDTNDIFYCQDCGKKIEALYLND